MERWDPLAPLALFEGVRCLECGEIYSKPAAGSIVDKNPGCPACSYVGWIPLTLPPELVSLHSAAGPPQPRFVPAS